MNPTNHGPAWIFVALVFVGVIIVIRLSLESRQVSLTTDSLQARARDATTIDELKKIRDEIILLAEKNKHRRYLGDIVQVMMYVDGKIEGMCVQRLR